MTIVHGLFVLLLCASTASAQMQEVEIGGGGRAWDNYVLSTEDTELFELMQFKTEDDLADRVQALLDRGANPSVQSEYNYTALMWSIVRNHQSSTRVLAQAGADSESINAWGRNAIFLAAWEGRDESMSALLEHGANVSSCADHDGWTALHKASELGHVEQVNLKPCNKPTRYQPCQMPACPHPRAERMMCNVDTIQTLAANAFAADRLSCVGCDGR